jgi:hypothetical protein
MRTTSLQIAAALAVVIACGCKSTPLSPADRLGTFTCTRNDKADGADSACVDSTDHFATTTPVIHVTYNTADLPKPGDTWVIQWIAVDVGQAAPPNTTIVTANEAVKDVPAATRSYTYNGNLTKPTNGWPVGKYRVEIKSGDKVLTAAKFTIQ